MDPGDDSDEALMQRIAGAADRSALQILLQRHARRSLQLAAHTLGGVGDAEGIVQDAFLRVWQHARSFDGARAKFTTWLHRVVVNLCIDELRRARPDAVDDEVLAQVADDAPSTLARLLANERVAALHAALRRLPARQRAAIVLFHFHESPVRECAQAMELSDKAFESLLTRARQALRSALEATTVDGDHPR